MNSRGPSPLPALSGIQTTLSLRLVGTTVAQMLFRKDYHLELGYQGTEGGGKAACGPDYVDQVQPHWQ